VEFAAWWNQDFVLGQAFEPDFRVGGQALKPDVSLERLTYGRRVPIAGALTR
jgi:hypothetical protein